MFIATTQEKRRQVGLAQILHLLEHCADSMVLQESVYARDVCVWGEIFGHEDCHGDPPGNKVYSEDDGSSNLWRVVYLWGQHVSN